MREIELEGIFSKKRKRPLFFSFFCFPSCSILLWFLFLFSFLRYILVSIPHSASPATMLTCTLVTIYLQPPYYHSFSFDFTSLNLSSSIPSFLFPFSYSISLLTPFSRTLFSGHLIFILLLPPSVKF